VIFSTLAHQLPDRRRNVHSHPSLSLMLKPHTSLPSDLLHLLQNTHRARRWLNFPSPFLSLSLWHTFTHSSMVFTVR